MPPNNSFDRSDGSVKSLPIFDCVALFLLLDHNPSLTLALQGAHAMKFNHIGIPTTDRFDGEIDLPHLSITVSDHQSNPFGIQWQRYWDGAPYPDLVKTVAHVA